MVKGPLVPNNADDVPPASSPMVVLAMEAIGETVIREVSFYPKLGETCRLAENTVTTKGSVLVPTASLGMVEKFNGPG